MTKDEIENAFSESSDKICDIECLLSAISKLDPGSQESRLADMAKTLLKDVGHTISKLELAS